MLPPGTVTLLRRCMPWVEGAEMTASRHVALTVTFVLEVRLTLAPITHAVFP